MPSGPDLVADDVALMLLAKRGDMAAFTTLVERWQQPILHFVYRMVSDREEAEDLAQGVFVQLWKTAERYEPAARFSTFLFTIARNLCLNELRRRGRHPADRLDAPLNVDGGEEMGRQHRDPNQPGPGAETERAELFSKVDEALADLPERQRTAVALCRDGELSYEEIAEVLELSLPATKSLIFRAREVLRTRLKSYLSDGSWSSVPPTEVKGTPLVNQPSEPNRPSGNNFSRSAVI